MPQRGGVHRCLPRLGPGDGLPAGRVEVLVADGRSDDGTREIVERCAARNPCVRLLDNPARITPAPQHGDSRRHGRRDHPHGRARCVSARLRLPARHALQETGADNVGGVVVTLPADNTPIARASPWRSRTRSAWGMPTSGSASRAPAGGHRAVRLLPAGVVRPRRHVRRGDGPQPGRRVQPAPDRARRPHSAAAGCRGAVLRAPFARGRRADVYQYGYFKPLVARKPSAS